MKKEELERNLDLTLERQYDLPDWAKFRGEHHPQSCICDADGVVVGLILKALDKTELSIPELKQLEYCCISDNPKLEKLEFQVALPNLSHLDVSDSPELAELILPEGFQQLITLDTHRTRIRNTDSFLGEFPELTMLDLSNNGLKNFQAERLKDFPKLKYLYLSGNTLNKSLSVYHKNKGRGNYLAAMKTLKGELEDGTKVKNDTYKVLLVGDGKTGKTCLVKVLVDKEFPEKWDSTHGISVKIYQDKDEEFRFPFTLNIWDFGGQDIYHATHRLFMQSDTTYLLLWNQKSEVENLPTIDKDGWEWKNKQVNYWLKYIQHLGGKSPVIMVQSWSDPIDPKSHPEKSKIDQRYRRYFEPFKWVAIESKLEHEEKEGGFDQLMLDIKKAIKLLGRDEYLPEKWIKIKEELISLYQPQSVDSPKAFLKKPDKVITKEEYLKIAAKYGEKDPEALLKNWLVETGTVFYREGLFKDHIILDQEWAIKAIYVLFERNAKGPYAKITGNDGRFTGKQLNEFWKERQYTIDEKNLFISMMVKCQMIFRIKEKNDSNKPFEEREYIAIELLPENKRPVSFSFQEEIWEEQDTEMLYVKYQYDFWHFGIIQSFIANTYQHFDVKDLYRKGVLLKGENKSKAIVEAKDKDSILIKVPRKDKQLLDKILNLFKEIHQSNDKVIEWVSPNPNEFIPLKELQNALKENANQVKTQAGTYVALNAYQIFLVLDEKSKFEKITAEEIIEEEEIVNEKTRGVVKREYLKEASNVIEIEGNVRKFVPFKDIKEKVKILFLSATPSHLGQMNTPKEGRFKDLFEYFDKEQRFNFIPEYGITADQFKRFLIFQDPHIVHYGGHGDKEGIHLEEENLEGDILRDILELSQNTQCVILNACYSVSIAKKVALHIPYVIGTQDRIDDRTAIAFAKGFYMGIVANRSIEDSFKLGLIEIRHEKLPDEENFILVKGINPNAQLVTESDRSSIEKKRKKKKGKKKKKKGSKETVVKIQISQESNLSEQISELGDKFDAGFINLTQTLDNLSLELSNELKEVLKKAEEGKIPTIDMQQIMMKIEKGLQMHNENLPEEIVKTWKQVNEKSAEQLDVKGKFKLTIPLIPLFLKYEQELSLDLVKIGRNIWKKGILF